MSNDLTSTPYLWILDSRGILSETPVYIKQIYYVPNAQADDLSFKQWTEDSVVAAGSLNQKTGTITSTKTLTSTGNLPTTIEAGYIFRITHTTGTADNKGRKLVEAAGDANAVTITEDDWTNEATKVYNWQTFASEIAIAMKANSGDTSSVQLEFGDKGRRFPNLALDVIDGGTVYVYLLRY